MIATRHLPAGTKILTEKPLFTVAMPEMVEGQGHRITEMISELEQEFSKLSPEQQNEYLDQHDYRFPGETHTRLLSILRSNAYNTGDNHVGSFPKTARINHSCRPNCGNFWSEKTGQRVIYAESDIKKGDEITVSYIPLLKSIKERQARLKQYGFVCDCTACQSTESSKKRVKISDLLESLEQKAYSASKKDETNERLIKKAVALVGLIEEEGLTNYLARAFRLASVFNQRRGNLKVALEWAAKELEMHQWAEVDSEEALATMHYMETLRDEK
jgi:SET domain